MIYCEICGAPIEFGKGRKVYVDGAELNICPVCATKLSTRTVKQEVQQQILRSSSRLLQSVGRGATTSSSTKSGFTKKEDVVQVSKPTKVTRGVVEEKLELVEDFAERIRRAREALGWDQRTLALKLKVSENVVKRIENGKLRPPIDLARKIEEVLNVKILVPAVEDLIGNKGKVEKYVTFGEIVSIRGVEEE